MPNYKVRGYLKVGIDYIVSAESQREALRKARLNCQISTMSKKDDVLGIHGDNGSFDYNGEDPDFYEATLITD